VAGVAAGDVGAVADRAAHAGHGPLDASGAPARRVDGVAGRGLGRPRRRREGEAAQQVAQVVRHDAEGVVAWGEGVASAPRPVAASTAA
jgi:hypothetical protein